MPFTHEVELTRRPIAWRPITLHKESILVEIFFFNFFKISLITSWAIALILLSTCQRPACARICDNVIPTWVLAGLNYFTDGTTQPPRLDERLETLLSALTEIT